MTKEYNQLLGLRYYISTQLQEKCNFSQLIDTFQKCTFMRKSLKDLTLGRSLAGQLIGGQLIGANKRFYLGKYHNNQLFS